MTVKCECSWDHLDKKILFLSHSVCSDVLLWHLFLEHRLIRCSPTWPFFPRLSQSVCLATGNRFWSWFCASTALVLRDTHWHCFCLVLLSTGSTFKKKKRIGLSLVSVLHQCSEQTACASALAPVVATDHSERKSVTGLTAPACVLWARFW